MTVDDLIVHERLRLMRGLLNDLHEIGEVSVERFEKDRIIRHAVERILTQLVDLSVSINSHIVASIRNVAPATYRESFSAVAEVGVISPELAAELAPSAGLRNVLTHEYVTVDLRLVARAVPVADAAYRQYVADVARYLGTAS